MTSRVLLYHHIAPEPSARFTVSPESFKAQIAWLLERGFQFQTLGDFLSADAGERRVFITFDDGYADTYCYAFPLLRACKLTASVFLITDYIGRSNGWEHAGQPCYKHLEHAQIVEMCASGWEMHSHTASHADFSRLSQEEIAADVRHATRMIRCWNPGPLFCAFPYGRSEPRLIEALQGQGYAGAFIAERSWPTTDLFRLPRIPVLDEGLEYFQSLFPEVTR